MMPIIRPCRSDEQPAIAALINAAAERYRGAIPSDLFHEPYMGEEELAAEIASGVRFWGYEIADGLTGVMGLQIVNDQPLIRHAYVDPKCQKRGIGTQLLHLLLRETPSPILVGTWADAAWAICFYQKNGFSLIAPEEYARVLRTYWTVSARQIETSVVLRYDPD